MGQTRFEKTGNYIVFTDVDSGLETQHPSKDLRYTMDKETVKFYKQDVQIKPRDGFLVGLTGTVNLDSGASGSVNGITVDSIEIMSGPESFITSLTVTATNVASNITAFTSVPNYSATSSGALITIKIESEHTAVDGLAVVSSVTTIASTDVNMGVDTGNLEKTAGTLFISLAELVTFLRANTGA